MRALSMRVCISAACKVIDPESEVGLSVPLIIGKINSHEKPLIDKSSGFR